MFTQIAINNFKEKKFIRLDFLVLITPIRFPNEFQTCNQKLCQIETHKENPSRSQSFPSERNRHKSDAMKGKKYFHLHPFCSPHKFSHESKPEQVLSSTALLDTITTQFLLLLTISCPVAFKIVCSILASSCIFITSKHFPIDFQWLNKQKKPKNYREN